MRLSHCFGNSVTADAPRVPATPLSPCCSNPSAKGRRHYHAGFGDATSLIGRQKSGNATIAYSGVKRRN